MATISERLIEALSIRGLKQADLVSRTGIGKSSISTYIAGDYEPKQRNIFKMAQALNVSEAWLMGYDVPMERNGASGTDEPDPYARFPEPNVTEDVVTFPVIGTAAAGYDHVAEEVWDGDTVDIPTEFLHGRPKSDYFVLNIHGDSMYPMYLEGDKVLVLKADTLEYSGQVGLLLYNGDEATLKKVEFTMGEDWLRMIPINPMYPTKTIEGADLEQCRVLGIPKLVVREV